MAKSFIGFEPIDVPKTVAMIEARGGDIAGLDVTLNQINKDAKKKNLNARLIASVVFHETDGADSWRYRNWRNPGGIAIPHGGAIEVWRPERPSPEEVGSMIVAAFAQKIYRTNVEEDIPLAYQVKGMRDWLKRSLWFTQGPNYPNSTTTTEHMTLPFTDQSGELQYVWAEDQHWDAGVERWYALVPSGKDHVPMQTIVAEACNIRSSVITWNQSNRPAIPMPEPSFVTVHEVGNLSPGADEFMHEKFVHDGGGQYNVSFHFIVGPTEAIQLIYINENAWHASDGFTGRGNRDTIAIETVQIGDFDKTLRHLAYLIAEIYRNPSRFTARGDVGFTDDLAPDLVKERTKQHNFWAPDKKNCPQFIRQNGLWVPLLNAVSAELADKAPDGPKYAPPIVPDWWSEEALLDLRSHREDGVLYQPQGMRLVCIARNKDGTPGQTGAYAHPWDPAGKGKRTREDIQYGEAVDLRYRATNPHNGDKWGLTRFGTWIALKNFDPQVTYRYSAKA